MSRDLSDMRETYDRATLRRADLTPDPIELFGRWFDEWAASGTYDPAACVLATADVTGRPSARFVLCRGFGDDGFVVYTNFESRKGAELRANPRGALVFGWLEHNRQVRVEGPVTVLEDAESDAYWESRPRGSRIGAWASDQSEVIEGRAQLERQLAEASERFGGEDGDGPIPRPTYWGGFRVGIESIEFWQGRPDRLHDRFRYRRSEADPAVWSVDRLSP